MASNSDYFQKYEYVVSQIGIMRAHICDATQIMENVSVHMQTLRMQDEELLILMRRLQENITETSKMVGRCLELTQKMQDAFMQFNIPMIYGPPSSFEDINPSFI